MSFTLANIVTVGVTNPANNRPAVNAPIQVNNAGSATLATLYSYPSDGSEIPMASAGLVGQPITSDANGNVTFAAAPAEYDLYSNGVKFATVTVEPDPRDVGNKGFFDPADFGAKGDYQATDMSFISLANPTILVSQFNAWRPADVGKYVRVAGAGVGGADLVTKITSFVNSSEVMIANAASTAVSGGAVEWGTDDSAAFQAIIDQIASNTAEKTQQRIYMPAAYVFASTLLFQGVSVVMEGDGWGNLYFPGYNTQSSLIKWLGPAGDPVIRVESCWGTTLRNFRILGGSAANNPSSGIEMSNPSTGARNSYNVIDHIAFGTIAYDNTAVSGTMASGVQFVAPGGGGNNDMNHLRDCLFDNCGTGIDLNAGATQAVWNLIERCSFNACGVGIACGATNIYAEGLDFGGSTTTDLYIASGARAYVRGMDTEGSTCMFQMAGGGSNSELFLQDAELGVSGPSVGGHFGGHVLESLDGAPCTVVWRAVRLQSDAWTGGTPLIVMAPSAGTAAAKYFDWEGWSDFRMDAPISMPISTAVAGDIRQYRGKHIYDNTQWNNYVQGNQAPVGTNPNNLGHQATINGTSGTAVWSMPSQTAQYKRVVVYLNGYADTTAQPITYPIPFSTVAQITSASIPTGVSTSLTALTLPTSGTVETGLVIVEGY